MKEISPRSALAILHGRRFADLPSLKFALMLGDRARYLAAGPLVVVTFPPDRLVWDGSDYGYARAVHLISGIDREGLEGYLCGLPPGKHIIKGSSLEETDLPPALSPRRITGFISLTAPEGVTGAPSCHVMASRRPSEDFAPLLEEVHYTPAEAAELMGENGVFLALRVGNAPAACGLIYHNYGEIWEIGALAVAPPFRRRGLGRELVSHALSRLTGEKLFVRYQMNEDNAPSLNLALSLGLKPFMRYSHFEITRGG